ncbi:MAG: hypothetical protein HY694_08265 [Deltaproteobacteria bacterium]|nr:hypothetical protein [Deltaproteobacteria bacterium]
MRRRNFLAVLLTLLFGILPVGFVIAGEGDPKTPVSPSPGGEEKGEGAGRAADKAAKEGASPSGPQEGIKVHGHWTIEVRNPDGTVVERREFKNALIGGSALVSILARQRSVGLWHVLLLAGSGQTQPCSTAQGGGADCFIAESASSLSGPNVFKTLTVSVPTEGLNAGKLVLSGTATASNTTQIARVQTSNVTCSPNFAPSNCAPGTFLFGITLTTLTSPISVSQGQQVQVTQVIGFQ